MSSNTSIWRCTAYDASPMSAIWPCYLPRSCIQGLSSLLGTLIPVVACFGPVPYSAILLLVDRKPMTGSMSILARIDTYNSFATILWILSAAPLSKNVDAWSTSNRVLLAGVLAWCRRSRPHASIASCKYLFILITTVPSSVYLMFMPRKNVFPSSGHRHLSKLFFQLVYDHCYHFRVIMWNLGIIHVPRNRTLLSFDHVILNARVLRI